MCINRTTFWSPWQFYTKTLVCICFCKWRSLSLSPLRCLNDPLMTGKERICRARILISRSLVLVISCPCFIYFFVTRARPRTYWFSSNCIFINSSYHYICLYIHLYIQVQHTNTKAITIGKSLFFKFIVWFIL